ncbi:MAG: NUDIX hydrolase [Armatimonadetes bacterium]|nr:NUDIX hydrolase [Armatimonadota bacterium]
MACIQPRLRASVAVQNDGGLLLVRHQKNGRTYWLLPGGGVEFGESVHRAAEREVQEETGIEVEVGPLLLSCETIAPDRSRHIVHLIFAGTARGGVLRVGQEARLAEAKFVPLNEVTQLVFHPPLAEPLMQALRGRFGQRDRFLGSLWID